MYSGENAHDLSMRARLIHRKGETINKDCEDDDEMREEYDFSKGVKNPYFQGFRELNLVSLDNDVKAAFPDSEAVNTALRGLIKAQAVAVPVELKKAS